MPDLPEISSDPRSGEDSGEDRLDDPNGNTDRDLRLLIDSARDYAMILLDAERRKTRRFPLVFGRDISMMWLY